jgi:hypothetical protein
MDVRWIHSMNSNSVSPEGRYEYRVDPWRARARLIFGSLLTILALYAIYRGMIQSQFALVITGVAIPLVLSFLALQLQRVVRYIQFLPGGQIEFGRWRGAKVIPASDIRSLRPSRTGYGAATLLHRGGRLLIVSQMDGWTEVIARLRELNPSVEIHGF